MKNTQLTTSTPLANDQLNDLLALTTRLSPIQLAWVSGFLAGQQAETFSQQSALHAPQPVAAATSMTILVGSQTGNARTVATQLAEQAAQQGLPHQLVNMADFKPNKLKGETFVVLVVSTHGEGEPPDDALELYKFLHGKKAPKLDGLQFSVFALGDASYEFFCKTGHDFHAQLTHLGATALLPVVECDVEFEQPAVAWSKDVLGLLAEQQDQAPAQPLASVTPINGQVLSKYNRSHPFAAEILANQKITSRHASKDVRHIELSLAGSELTYQPGDALGVWFSNDPAVVEGIIRGLGLSADAKVEFNGQQGSLAEVLREHVELSLLTPKIVQNYSELADNAALSAIVADKEALRQLIDSHQLIDLVKHYPLTTDAQTLVSLLRPLAPRLYSIASAQSEVEDEVHLTVAKVAYHAHGEDHLGAASGFLAERVGSDGDVKVFIQPNTHFRLPHNPATDIIMIGPGTGIAPFRAFLQEREATEATGRNWLFFGNQHFLDDFLYQAELVKYRDQGVLTHFDVAFSRDQAEKVYVQQRLLERGAEVYQWLESGAHLYICGDATRMAKDVHSALLEVLKTHGQLDTDAAEAYLEQLRADKRYQKDVY